MSNLNDEQLRVLALILREPQEESSNLEPTVSLRQELSDNTFDQISELAGRRLAGR